MIVSRYAPGEAHEDLFTSDLHGLIRALKRFAALLKHGAYDLGIVAGDILEYADRQFERLCDPTGSLIGKRPANPVFVPAYGALK